MTRTDTGFGVIGRCAAIIAVLTTVIWASTEIAFAQPNAPLSPYRSLRALGMGNAYEAIASDLTSFDYNPAGLARIERLTLRIVPAQMGVTKDLADEISQISDLLTDIENVSSENETDILGSDTADRLVERIRGIRREDLRLRGSLFVASAALPLPSIGGFGLVVGASVTNQFLTGFRIRPAGLAWGSEILDLIDDTIVMDTSLEVLTMQFAAAGETTLVDTPFIQRIRAGVNYRLVRRRFRRDEFTFADMLEPERFKKEHLNIEVDEVSSLGDIIDIIDANTNREDGFGIDVGLQIDHTDYLSSALVVRSLASSFADLGFPRTTTISVAARPLRFLKLNNPLLALLVTGGLSSRAGDDAQDEFLIGAFTDRIHLGAEATIFPSSPINASVRLGNNQGFLTAGAEVRLLFIRAGLAYHGDLEADWWTGGVSFNF